MKRSAQDITAAELAVLEFLWKGGATAIRPIASALYPGGSASAYATVQKLLERLEAKGFVRRDRSGRVHVFSPAVNRDTLIGRWLRSLADKFCKGSLSPLLTHLVKIGRLTAEERRDLRNWLEESEKIPAGKGKNRPRDP